MKMRSLSRTILFLLACMCTSGSLVAQITVSELRDEIEAGHVHLVSATGNGSSSGMAVTAYLINRTGAARRINVNLTRPIFLINSGRGQNMIAVQVYLSGGSYTSDGHRSFIILRPQARASVVFVAFCADFEEDNPTAADSFSLGNLPPSLGRVVSNVRAYMIANPDADAVAAGQAAIWLAQGLSIEEIRSRFEVTPSQERLAQQFLQ